MKYSKAETGAVYIMRLEHGEIVHKEIEKFVQEHNIYSAVVTLVGGIDKDSHLVVGPEDRNASPVMPMYLTVGDAHETLGTGTIFPDDTGKPVLHMHIAAGRNNDTLVGCIREGIVTWHVLEVIIIELKNCTAKRLPDAETGFKLLIP